MVGRKAHLTPHSVDAKSRDVSTPLTEPGSDRSVGGLPTLTAFELLVVLPTVLGGAYLVRQSFPDWTEDGLFLDFIIWTGVLALVELIPVPAWRGLQMSMGFPVLIATAILYDPVFCATIALIGSFDPREFKREVGLLRALFNRSQVALSVAAASLVFSELATVDSAFPALMGAAMLAAAADYTVNSFLVAVGASILYKISPAAVIRRLRIGRPTEFLVSYLGLGVLGLILAKFHREIGFWSVAAFLAPLLFARQMFFRSRALEEAHRELQAREQILRALSTRMAEERQDERQQIAGYLHDDLAQILFRLSLEADVAKRHLNKGDVESTGQTLDKIRNTKQQMSEAIRALIRDLHRSPLGRKGLAEALDGFVAEMGRESETRFHTDVAEIELPPPIALLVYHVAREATMNAIKHAEPRNVWIEVREQEQDVELIVRDDGKGFDVEAPPPEGHYGLEMMRERAMVAGGTYELASAPGQGTVVTARFPTAWYQEDEASATSPAARPASVAGRGATTREAPEEPDSEEQGPASALA